MTIVNPPRSGDVIDFTDPSKFLLTVNDTPVYFSHPQTGVSTPGTTNMFAMDNLAVSYDGKKLAFTEFTSIGSATFQPNHVVTLDMDLGTGMKRRFTGRIVRQTFTGKNNNESVQYVANGIQYLANDVQVDNGEGLPHVGFAAGTSWVATIANGSVYGRPIESAVNDLFDACAGALAEQGIPTAIGTPGTGTFTNFLHDEVKIKNSGFVSALKQLVAHEPTKKVFFDDEQQAWTFPNVTDQVEAVVDVSSVNVGSLNYSADASDRYTAIEMYTYVSGSSTFPNKGYALCQPVWAEVDEASACTATVMGRDSEGNPDGGKAAYVYRQWRIPDIVSEHQPGTPVTLYAQHDFGGQTRFVPYDAHVDWKNRLITSKAMLVEKGNPHHPGHAKGPVNVWVTWWKISSSPSSGWPYFRYPAMTYVTTITSTGTEVSVPNPSDPSCWSGTAYSLYGVQKTKREIVDPRAFTTANAQAKLALLKDVKINGTIPLDGDPIEEFMNLQRLVRVTHATKSVGALESTQAMLTSYTYTFGSRGRSDITLANDMSGMVLTF